MVIRPSRAKKRPAPTPVEEVEEDEGEEMEQEETKVPEQEIEMNQNRDADDGDPSDQESIPVNIYNKFSNISIFNLIQLLLGRGRSIQCGSISSQLRGQFNF